MKKKILKYIIFCFIIVIISINKNIYATEKEQINDLNNTEEKTKKEIVIENKSMNENHNIVLKDAQIEDGFYQLISSTGKNWDIEGAKNDKNALLETWTSNGQANQRFKIKKQSDGTYKIFALHSELALEVDGNNIKQNTETSSDNQKWKIEIALDGRYYIKSVSTNLYIYENSNTKLNLTELKEENSLKFEINKKAKISGTKIIKEGYYIIQSNLDSNKVLEINGAVKTNGANIQIGSKNYGSNQIFELIYNEQQGTYQIKSALSGKKISIQGKSKEREANVNIGDSASGKWQEWVIEKKENQLYSISSAYSGLYIDIANGNTNDGTNVELYEGHNGSNQKFLFEEIDKIKESSNIDRGIYQIKVASNQNKVIDILGGKTIDGETAGIWDNYTYANQRYKIIRKENGYYSIINLNSGLYLEADGTMIKQRNLDNNTIAQDWALVEQEKDTYYIISRCGYTYLTYEGNTLLKLTTKRNNNSQKFILRKDANIDGKQTITDGYYIIKSAINTNKAIDIESASISNEANAVLWDKYGRNNQKFKFTYDGNGYYTITSVKSKKLLDVYRGEKENCSNVQQYQSNNGTGQKWMIEKNPDGTYSIISVHNGLYIDLPYGSTKNGNNIQLYHKNDGENQKFILEKTNGIEGTKTIESGYYKINTSLNNNQFLDVGNGSKKDHTKTTIWENHNGYNQSFKITYRGNGFYTIIAAHSGKAMDLASDGKTLEQDNLTYEEEQEWAIKKGPNGLYYIISAHNALNLSVNGSGTSGNSVTVAKNNNLQNQLFKFSSTNVETGEKTISDGTYQIITNLDSNKVLDIEGGSNSSGANVEIWSNNRQNNQKFNIRYQGNGYYKIFAVNSGKALGVEEAGTGNLVNVRQYDVSDSIQQDWFIKSCGNGNYNIISACNGLYLDVFEGHTSDGTNIEVYTKNNGSGQKFKFQTPFQLEVTTGTYGSSGLKIKGDNRGQNLKYYKIGNGPNVFFATFAIHGWEDLYDYDGQALTKIAEDFKNKLIGMQDKSLSDKWTMYIFPSLNPDGEYHGNSHNGPGRTTLYSAAPGNKGIDMNRCWSTGYSKETKDRNYNGTEPFQAYESRALRDFLLNKKATNGQTVLVDLHGWLNETMGDNGIGSYYRPKYGISKHIDTYGRGYLINWARSNLGSNGRAARSCLVELPEWNRDSWRYIDATLDMLRNIV